MPQLPYPVIVVPGITATYLRDDYPLPPEAIWTVLTKDYERSALHPNDLRYELKNPARVRADQLYEVAYKELIAELRNGLTRSPDRPVPVYPFGYDWRHPLVDIEEKLSAFIDEVIDRTKLMRHYHEDGYADNPRVNLVGHSMGGLVIAGYVERFGAGKLCKVASLASPFRGSFEAVLKIATGNANMGSGDSSAREREAARLTPALYHLLPSYEGGLFDSKTGDALDGDGLFKAETWQKGVLETLTSFVTLNGLPPKNTADHAKTLFDELLEGAKKHRERLEKLNLDEAGLGVDNWLCVIGTHSSTRVRLGVDSSGASPVFDLSPKYRLDNWGREDGVDQLDTGDGTVPLRGALNGFIPDNKVVCVTPEDYGYWEVQDKMMTSVAGFHGILPNMDMIHRLLARFFTGAADPYGNTWGRPLPTLPRDQWKPPLAL